MGSFLRLREPYQPAVVKARVGVGASDGCGCTQSSAEVFVALDMPHAAGMHAAGEGRAPWGIPDWSLHLDEEEAPGKFFEALRAIAAKMPAHSREHLDGEVDRLVAEHDVVREGLARGAAPEDSVARAHGDREDALVRRYHSQLMAYAAWRKRTRVGVDKVRTGFSPILLGEDIDCGVLKTTSTVDHVTFVSPTPPRAPDGFTGGTLFWKTGTEKFMDPWFNCLGMHGDSAIAERLHLWVSQPDAYGYLTDVPLDGASRVAAMRAKVDANSDAGSLDNSALRNMRENSQEAIRKIGLNLVTLYKDPARRDELVAKYASVFKRAVSEIESDRDKVEQIIKMGPPELSEQLAVLMREAKPMIDEVKRGVSDFASQVAVSTASDASKAFSSISAAVPIIGAVVQLGMSLYDMIQKQQAEGAERATAGCNRVLKEGNDYLSATIERGFPIPWHALEWVVSNPCGGLTEDDQFKVAPWPVQGFRAAMYNNLVRLYCLPLGAQQDVIQWWAHATAMMTHEEVARIFAALGDDHTFGGMLASDEQVLLVAAPIAVANGLDPYAFAAALWDRSKGWSASPEMLRREEMIKAGDETSAFWPSLASSFEDPRIGQYTDPCLMTQPNNAMQVQWAVLARDAFKLVEDFKVGAVTVNEQILLDVMPGKSPIGATSTLKRAGVPLAIGAAASGALYFAGMSIGIALAPLGAALLWVLLAPSTNTPTPAPAPRCPGPHCIEIAKPSGDGLMLAKPMREPPPGFDVALAVRGVPDMIRLRSPYVWRK